MNRSGTSPVAVGQQLARRRDALDVTQDELAMRIGIAARTVSAVERGVNSISRGKRSDWERALGLKAGTIGRAYREGMLVEALAEDSPDVADSHAHLAAGGIRHEIAELKTELREIVAVHNEVGDKITRLEGRVDETLERILVKLEEPSQRKHG